MHLAGPPPGGVGAITIVESHQAESETQREAFERRGFRMEPLAAIEAYTAQQLEFAKLAAEREYDKRHRLAKNPRAVAEVDAAEDAAGAVHLPTIPETPIRRRGRPTKKAD